ncbi:2-amino-4-hydroxy-6-hydroxymethyldihydropteridine diphosphokinase [bacterium]|nr:MAG: 2-amino-4-hydroxy-6-hydroxymethyldihydropteridine diphosphokinase [bacterium]
MGIDAYIALGSNLGDRHANIQGGLDAIALLPSTTVVQCSTIIETDPIGPGDQGCYLNGAVHIETELEPRVLLDSLLKIEARFGRDREKEIRWGARTLDLDVLVYGDLVIDEPGLEIPHPRLHTRSFVLIPMAEIASNLILPRYKKTPQVLLEVLESLS